MMKGVEGRRRAASWPRCWALAVYTALNGVQEPQVGSALTAPRTQGTLQLLLSLLGLPRARASSRMLGGLGSRQVDTPGGRRLELFRAATKSA